jgi:hypothetical protein
MLEINPIKHCSKFTARFPDVSVPPKSTISIGNETFSWFFLKENARSAFQKEHWIILEAV